MGYGGLTEQPIDRAAVWLQGADCRVPAGEEQMSTTHAAKKEENLETCKFVCKLHNFLGDATTTATKCK